MLLLYRRFRLPPPTALPMRQKSLGSIESFEESLAASASSGALAPVPTLDANSPSPPFSSRLNYFPVAEKGTREMRGEGCARERRLSESPPFDGSSAVLGSGGINAQSESPSCHIQIPERKFLDSGFCGRAVSGMESVSAVSAAAVSC